MNRLSRQLAGGLSIATGVAGLATGIPGVAMLGIGIAGLGAMLFMGAQHY